jgi:hypothetical protein
MKLGKRAPKRLMKTPALGDYLPKATSWPAVPAQGWESAVPPAALNILGNDLWGDCAEAAALGLIQAMSYNVGRPLIPTTQDALNLYSAVAGFDITMGPSGNNPTDNGTVLTDLLTYWQKTGISVGTAVHKIVGFATLDITSLAQMRYATYLFGGSYLGINCPQSAEDNTSNWTYNASSPIIGGHCVARVGEGSAGGKTRSWGMFIPTANDFYLNYLDEGYIVITQDWLDANGKTPTGLDLTGLLAAMSAL